LYSIATRVGMGEVEVKRKARVFGRSVAILALASAWACTNAGANHSLKEQISIGPGGGNGAVNAFFDAASSDGSRVVFETNESLVPADTDTSFDIYQRLGTTTTLLSTGPSGGNGANDAFFDAASADGRHVFFDTDESLVPADTDNSIDVYEYFNGTVTLVSTGPAGGNGAFDVFFDGISADGLHAYFETDEQLTAADTDATTDIYDRSGGTTSLVSTGPTPGTGGDFPVFWAASDDGSHAFFDTDQSLVAADTDTSVDIYDRSGGTTTLISTGPNGGNGTPAATFEGNSSDGSRVFFSTMESLVAGDTDTQPDVYERVGSTTNLLSTGPTGGNGAIGAFFTGSSTDGAHVFFSTSEALVAGDTDTKRDIYDRSGGTTTQISTGPGGGNGAFDAFFDGSSANGTRVWFDTTESLVAGDTDTRADVYERAGGTTTQLTTGSTGGNGAFDAFFGGASLDGLRVFFTTKEQLEATDTDAATDVYERFTGFTTHISIGSTGGNGTQNAFYDGASADGARAFFNTSESLLPSDTDLTRDVYAATVNGFARPKGATPFRVAFVPAYTACTAPNRQHGGPLNALSCNPPAQTSTQLTLGTLDANGQTPNGIASARYDAIPGNANTPANEADVKLAVSLADVRKTDLSDYTGELQLDTVLRITDKNNGSGPSGGVEAGTTDADFPVTVPCTGTLSTTVGSTCSLVTQFNAIQPGAVVEEKRSNWQIATVQVFDGGADGLVSTTPNTLFETQGIFTP
jgi:hypothetical protein